MSFITRTDHDGVATLTMDDGKKNALDTAVFAAITAAFDDAADAKAIVLAGREDVFSAGLNIKLMPTLDLAGMSELLSAFGSTLMRVWTNPTPVVAAATGHALAGGTMFAMAADHAVAADGAYWWGLTETRINFAMPRFGIALAKGNLRRDRLDDLLLPGLQVDVATALEVGYCDEVVAPADVVTRAQAKAAELAALPAGAYAETKKRLRQAAADDVLAGLDEDVDALLRAVGFTS